MLENNPRRTADKAFIFEVDTALLHGISRSVEPLQALFRDNGVTLDKWQFIQKIIGVTPERIAETLFNNHPGIAEEIRTTVQKTLDAGLDTFAAQVNTAVTKAASKGARIVLVSALPDTRLKDTLGDALKDQVSIIQVTRSHCFVYRPDMWKAICARSGLYERMCVAVVGSGISCRSALVADLHVVVACDPLMEGNDYGGADYVGTAVDTKLINAGLRCLRLA